MKTKQPRPIWIVVCADGVPSMAHLSMSVFNDKVSAKQAAEDADNGCGGCGNVAPHRVVRYVPESSR